MSLWSAWTKFGFAELFNVRYTIRIARPRIVELDEVVVAAMACFREHGYDATSVRDLELATGLKAPSIYKAFGSKAGLFEAALDRYRRDVVDRRVNEHLRPDLGLSGIRSFFTSTYSVEPLPSHGCLLTNSAIEFSMIEQCAQRKVTRGLRAIREALGAQLHTARATGDLPSSLDIDSAADVLLVLYEGMLTLARTGRTMKVDFDRVIDATLQHLLHTTPSGATS
jgi:TetR/AcrR family transcriptional regulator, transcriptional repressor for nem operon